MKFSYKYFILPFAMYSALSNVDAFAATQTSTLTVTASVAASCTISSGTALDFGAYTGAQKDAQTTITVNCTNGATYTVDADAGSGTGATTTTRKLTSSTRTLDYTLYTDSGRTNIWKTGASVNYSGTGTGANQTITVYGRMPANATPYIGNYTDSVTLTINY